jgi:hypothetical protein
MRVLADNEAARLSRRLPAIPRRLRAIASLARPDRRRSVGRFATRHLMILVAVVAVILSAFRLWLVVPYRLQKAAFHERMAAFHAGRRAALNMTKADFVRLQNVVLPRREMAKLHFQMKEKWEDAAAHPWQPVEADPPGMSLHEP